MSIPTLIFATLAPLVSNRVYPGTFPETVPAFANWPAIRSTLVTSNNAATVCGTNSVATDDTHMQLDIVAAKYSDMLSLRDAVIAALMNLNPPCVRDGLQEVYDAETKTHRAILDVIFQQSS
jgi:Protein of unknown function (DUF3168)